jgi:hypothetical protein
MEPGFQVDNLKDGSEPGLSDPFLPVSRLTSQVHHGDNFYSIRSITKQDSERKGSCQATSDIPINDGIKSRVDSYACKTVFNGR